MKVTSTSRLLVVALMAAAGYPTGALARLRAQDNPRAQSSPPQQDNRRQPDNPRQQDDPRAAGMVLLNGQILLFHGIERKDAVARKDAPGSKGGGAPNDAAQRPQFAEAVAIAGGRIVFVGPGRQAKPYIGPTTQASDRGGARRLPGRVA